MDLVEAQGHVERRDAGLLVLPAQIVKQLVGGDGQIPDPTLEEIAGQRGFRGHQQLGRLRPAPTSRNRAPNRQRFSSYAPFWGRTWAMARRST